MPEQPVREASGLLTLAMRRIELAEGQVHKGVRAHLTAARVHLDAVSALLALDVPPPEPSRSEDL